MTRYPRIPRPAIGAVAILAVAGLALTGCKSSTSSSGSTGSAKASGKSSSSSGSSGSGGSTTTSIGTADFPAAAGDTWVYLSKTMDGTHTVTNKVIKLKSVSSGTEVTMSTADSAIGHLSTFSYIFHPDGSITVPMTQFGKGVKISGGGVIWPSQSVLADGQPHTYTLGFAMTIEGKTVRSKLHVTVKGAGTHSVTVPAGTYQAQLIDEVMSEKFDGVAIDMTLQTYLAPGVGPVKTSLGSKGAGLASAFASTEILKSFTKG